MMLSHEPCHFVNPQFKHAVNPVINSISLKGTHYISDKTEFNATVGQVAGE